MDLDAAANALSAAHLATGSTFKTRCVSSGKDGEVIGQDQAAGKNIPSGTPVNLTVRVLNQLGFPRECFKRVPVSDYAKYLKRG